MGRKGPGIIGGSIPRRSQDAITKKIIGAVSRQPTKTPAQQRKKQETVDKLTKSLTPKSRAAPAKNSSYTGKNTRAQTAQETSAQVEQPDVSARKNVVQGVQNSVQQTAPKLSEQLDNSFSLFGSDASGAKNAQQTASSAVSDIRTDSSPIARQIYQQAQDIPAQVQKNLQNATRTGALSSSGIRADWNKQTVQAAKEKAAQQPNRIQQVAALNEQLSEEHPLLSRAVKATVMGSSGSNPLAQAASNVITTGLGTENRKTLSERVDGDNAAAKTAASVLDTMDRIKGRFMGGVLQGTEDFAGSLASFGTKALGAGAGYLGAQGAANALNQASESVVKNGLIGNQGSKYQQTLTDKYGQQDGVSAFADNVAQSIGYMTPSLAASFATGGAAGAAKAGTGVAKAGSRLVSVFSKMSGGNTGLAVMAAQQAQSSANEAMEEGADLNHALAYGASAGALSVATERIAGGIPGMPEGVLTQAIARRMGNQTAKRVVTYALDKLGEGVEEVIETALTPYLKRAIYDSDAASATADEMVNSMMMGVVVSAILGAPSDVVNLRSGYHGDGDAGASADADAGQTSADRTLNAVREAVAQAQERRTQSGETSAETQQDSGSARTVQTEDASPSLAQEVARRTVQRGTDAGERTAGISSGEVSQTEPELRQTAARSEQAADADAGQTPADRTPQAQQDNAALAEDMIRRNQLAQLEDTVSQMSESEVYEAIKAGDISYDDLVEIIARRADAETAQESTARSDVKTSVGTQESAQTALQAQRAAQETAPVQENVQDAGQTAQTIADTINSFSQAYHNPEQRAGTILERLDNIDYQNAMQTLRAIYNAQDNPNTANAIAERYENVEIGYDADDQTVDIETANAVDSAAYELNRRLNRVVLKNHMQESDIRLADAAVEHGSLDWLWSENNSELPNDMNAVVEYFDVKQALERVMKPIRQYRAQFKNQTAEDKQPVVDEAIASRMNEVRRILESRRDEMPVEQYAEALDAIQDYQGKAIGGEENLALLDQTVDFIRDGGDIASAFDNLKVGRPLASQLRAKQRAHAETIADTLDSFFQTYHNPQRRAGTILERMDDTDYQLVMQTLRSLRDAQSNPNAAAAIADQYEDIEIDYDAEHPETVDTETLVEIENAAYDMKQRLRSIVSETHMQESDIRLADAAVRQGNLDWLWSDYNHQMPNDMSAVTEYFEIKQALNRMMKPIRRYRADFQNGLSLFATEHIRRIDRASDMRGARFALNTPQRNLRHVFKKTNANDGERMYQDYFAPLTKAESDVNRKLEAYRSRVRELKLNRQEAAYTQMMLDDDPSLKHSVASYFEENQQHIDMNKINRAVDEFRGIFAEVHELANAGLVRNGYDAMGKLENYSPHFEERLNRVQRFLRHRGLWRSDVVRLTEEQTGDYEYLENVEPREPGELPNAIAGRTEEFRGRHRWSGNIQHRYSDHTDYNILVAFEQYTQNMLEIAYMTDGISKLRVLEDQIRYETGGVEVQEQFDEIMRNQDDDPLTKRQKIENLFSDAQGFGDSISRTQQLKQKVLPPNNLSGFVTWLRRYTDNVAGKKSVDDRAMEFYAGRGAYDATRHVFNRILGNMTTTISSAATNIIPVVGSIADAGPVNVANAIRDTAKSTLHSDGFGDMSDFLVNRRGGGLSVTSDIIDRAQDVLQNVDRKSAEIVTRAYYRQALEQGRSHEEALEQANERAAQLMADRSKTQRPILFQTQNPVAKLFVSFQTEVANDIAHLVSDMPYRAKTEGTAHIARVIATSAVLYHVYNNVMQAAFGYRPYGLDFIEWLREVLDWDKDEDDEPDSGWDNLRELGSNVMKAVPVIGTFAGGGRVPMTSALPGGSFSGALDSVELLLGDKASGQEKVDELLNQWTKPLATLAPRAFGNQIRKTGLGLYTMAQGGSYTYNNAGERVLQAAVDKDNPMQWVQAAVAGKSALPSMQEYYDKEYSPLSAEQTEKYNEVLDGKIHIEGVDAPRFYQLLREYNTMTDDTDADGKAIDGTREYHMRQRIAELDDLSESTKRLLDSKLIGQRFDAADKPDSDVYNRTGVYDVPEEQRDAALYLSSVMKDTQYSSTRDAVYAGLDWNTALDVYEAIKDVDKVTQANPYTKNENNDAYLFSKAQNQALTIMYMDLTAEQKRLASWMADDSASNYDFTDETSLLSSMLLTDKQREALSAADLQGQGITADDVFQVAIHSNWDWNSYKNYWGDVTDNTPEGYKHYALYGMTQYTPEQKKAIGKILFDDPDNIRYDDKNTITACMVSTACGRKWPMANAFGYSIDEYVACWNAANDGDKKAEKVAEIVKQTGMEQSRAERFVSKISYGSVSDALKYTLDVDSGESTYSGGSSGGSYSGGGYYWSSGYRRRHSSGRSSRRSSGGGSSAAPTGDARKWSNAATGGYGAAEYANAYKAASMFKKPAEAVKSVMNATGWTWAKASTFCNLVLKG